MSEPWSKKELLAIWEQVVSESDRGCILLCGALLDRGLESLLRLKFRKASRASDTEIDSILSYKSPKAALVGFTSRARIAYLLGLINKETGNALRIFGRIRNDYAHKDSVPSLTEATLQPIIDALPEGDRCGHAILNSDPALVTTPARRSLTIITLLLHVELDICRKLLLNQADQPLIDSAQYLGPPGTQTT